MASARWAARCAARLAPWYVAARISGWRNVTWPSSTIEHAGCRPPARRGRAGPGPSASRAAEIRLQVAVGVGGDDDERVAQLGVERARARARPSAGRCGRRQRVGQHGPAGRARPARAGWPPRRARAGCRRPRRAGGGARRRSRRRRRASSCSATSSAGRAISMVAAEVGLGVGAAPAHGEHRDPLDVERARRCTRARGATAGRPTARSSTTMTIGAVLGGLGEQVARRDGDGERLDRRAAAGQGEGGRRIDAAARRRQRVDPVEVAVEEAGEARPRHLDLGLEALEPDDVERRSASATRRRTTSSSTAVLPTPGSPTSVRALPWPPAARRATSTSSSTRSSRPRSGAGRGRTSGGGVGGAVDIGCGAGTGAGGLRRRGMVAGIVSRRPSAAGRPRSRISVRGVGFTRAELEAFRDATVPDLVGPGPAPAVRRDQPRAVDGGDGDPLRPPRQPLLPGAAAGRRDRPGHRPRRRDDRRRPRLPRRAGHRDHQPRRPGDGAGRRAVGGRAARRRRAAASRSSPSTGRVVVAVAGVTAYRAAFGAPRRRARAAAASRSAAPSCGSSPTRAGSTPTRRSTRLAAAYRGAGRRGRHRRADRPDAPVTDRSDVRAEALGFGRGWRGTSRSSPAGRPRTASGPASRARARRATASTRRRGWPSGFVGSQRSSPSKPTRRAIVSTVSRIVTSWSVPRLTGCGTCPARRRPRRRARWPRRRRRRRGTRGWPGRCPTPRPCRRRARRASTHFLISAGMTCDTRRVELVAGAVEVRRDEVGEALAVLRGVDLGVHEVGLLGQAVRRVGLLRVAVPQALLAERHRRELRVRAHRADEHGLLDARRRAGGLDDVRAHQQVGEVQRRRLGLVVADAADAGGEVDDRLRAVVGEHAPRRRPGTVRSYSALRGATTSAPRRAQPGDHVAAEEPGAAGDEDAAAVARSGMRARLGARHAIMGGVRVAYTLEQCWHDAPGGTAVAALEVARRLAPCPDVTLVGVAGRHRAAPAPAWRSPIPVAQLPLPRPLLYESWLRLRRPLVERVTGPVDVAHATGFVPCATPGPARRHGARPRVGPRRRTATPARACACCGAASTSPATPPRSWSRRARPAAATSRPHGIEAARLRVVPLGVDEPPATPATRSPTVRRALRAARARSCCSSARSSRARTCAGWPPRSPRLDDPTAARRRRPDRLGRRRRRASTGDVRFLGFVPADDMRGAVRRRRRCSPTRASSRASGCRCSRRWRRARPS